MKNSAVSAKGVWDGDGAYSGAAAKKINIQQYKNWDKLNGQHPFQKAVPEAYLLYKARTRKEAKIAFFNYELAREMEMIEANHPNQMNPDLEKALIHQFGIVIINEYDIQNKIKYPENEIREKAYMATRYLQLQHPNQQGKTSGDGRSIWNGVWESKTGLWDVSSRGTGATSLSPATHIYKKFFQTGDPSISYGCGYADLEEGYETMFFSEIFHRNNVPTERVLAILEYPNNTAVIVRAHKNLMRPSHFFSHLKQSNRDVLQRMLDYFMDRQQKNKLWPKLSANKKARNKFFLQQMAKTFAEVAAKFEDEYIFCWLDWDGDNILMDGGIIDYGSIRQFGLFHHEYRFDDVERWSTSITEQKDKALYIVQCFAQMIDFLETGKKSNIQNFKNHWVTKDFKKYFENKKLENLLFKIGLNPVQQKYLLQKKLSLVKSFKESFSYFERAKSKKGKYKVADGITWDAIFCMRDILRELPQIMVLREEKLNPNEFLEIIASNYASSKDLANNEQRNKKIQDFQNQYRKLLQSLSPKFGNFEQVLMSVNTRSSVINKYDRITGDAIVGIVGNIMSNQKVKNPNQIYKLLNEFLSFQSFDPDKLSEQPIKASKDVQSILEIVRDLREGL